MSFEGKVIVVTGAGAGIGAKTATHLANLGGRLAIVDKNFENLKKVAESITKIGQHEPLVIVADVTEDSEHIIMETIEKFGKLDVLINNVGIVARQGLMDLQIDLFDRIMSVNVRSTVILTRLAVPYLEMTKGCIVNVSSVIGMRANPTLLAYSMSKAAINQFTKCIATELGPMGIRVNAVMPGIINTEMVSTIPEDQRDEMLNFVTNAYPLRRIGETNDVAGAITFLASNDASFITGSLLCVDGGATAGNILN